MYKADLSVLPTKVKTFMEELIELCRKHDASINGQFSVYAGDKRIHDVASVDYIERVWCLGSKYDPTQENRED